MDDIGEFNRQRWNALSESSVSFSRPWLDLTPDIARQRIDPEGMLGIVRGKSVLLLAGGGGQQSAAFGLLGAKVTVLDFSQKQLAADQQAAQHYGLSPNLIEGDMRELSCFSNSSFDLIWHAHSLGFIPDPRIVFQGVARILRESGIYRVSCANPFTSTSDEKTWTGEGYVIKDVYRDGSERTPTPWEIWTGSKSPKYVGGPREFNHSLSTLVNLPIQMGFQLLGIWEDGIEAGNSLPGSWAHFTSVCPPYLVIIWRLARAA